MGCLQFNQQAENQAEAFITSRSILKSVAVYPDIQFPPRITHSCWSHKCLRWKFILLSFPLKSRSQQARDEQLISSVLVSLYMCRRPVVPGFREAQYLSSASVGSILLSVQGNVPRLLGGRSCRGNPTRTLEGGQ